MKLKTFFLLLFILLLNGKIIAQEDKKAFAIFRDSLDHAIDISDFLLNK